MSDRKWHVACPYVDKFEECREVEREHGLVYVRADGVTHSVAEGVYDAAASSHAAKHAEQRAAFQAAAPAPWLGWAAWWYSYVKGYFKHGAFRNPLEAEARRAEDRRPKEEASP